MLCHSPGLGWMVKRMPPRWLSQPHALADAAACVGQCMGMRVTGRVIGAHVVPFCKNTGGDIRRVPQTRNFAPGKRKAPHDVRSCRGVALDSDRTVMTKDMTVGRPAPLILAFALPLLGGNLLQQFYSLVDAAIVGQFLGTTALAGVGASSSVLFLILGFCTGLAGGMGIPVAQSFGAREYGRMRSYVYNALLLSAGVSVVLTIGSALLCRSILGWMQTPRAIMPDAYAYLLCTFLSIPVMLLLNVLLSVLRALGDSRTPFYILLSTSVLNVGGDLVAILLLGWGVAGAAIATALSMAVGCAIAVRSLSRVDVLEGFMRSVPNVRHMDTLLGSGIPMGLQFSITAIGSIMLQSANNGLGTVCVAAFTTAMRIKACFICVLENLGVALATYCGQNRGAARVAETAAQAVHYLDRIRHGILSSLGMMLVYCVFCVAVLWPFSWDITACFVGYGETDILAHSQHFMRVTSLCYPVLGVLVVFRYSLQSIGFTKVAMLSGVNELLARMLVSVYLVPAFGFAGVCWGDPSAWLSADLFLVPTFVLTLRGMRRKVLAGLPRTQGAKREP